MRIIDLETMTLLENLPGYLTGIGGHVNTLIVPSNDSIAFSC